MPKLTSPTLCQTPIARVQALVADYYGMSVERMLHGGRKAEIAFARQMAMALARDIFDADYQTIADAFGIGCHGTVIHSCRRIAAAKQQKSTLATVYSMLLDKIMAGEKARLAQ